VKAVWSKSKKEVTEEEYVKFWEYFSNQKVAYKYKLHYSTDVPLSLKALLYIPNMHTEKYDNYNLNFNYQQDMEWYKKK